MVSGSKGNLTGFRRPTSLGGLASCSCAQRSFVLHSRAPRLLFLPSPRSRGSVSFLVGMARFLRGVLIRALSSYRRPVIPSMLSNYSFQRTPVHRLRSYKRCGAGAAKFRR